MVIIGVSIVQAGGVYISLIGGHLIKGYLVLLIIGPIISTRPASLSCIPGLLREVGFLFISRLVYKE